MIMYFKILIDWQCRSNFLGTSVLIYSVLIGMQRVYQDCKLIINDHRSCLIPGAVNTKQVWDIEIINAEEILGSFGSAYLQFLHQPFASRHPKSIKTSL